MAALVLMMTSKNCFTQFIPIWLGISAKESWAKNQKCTQAGIMSQVTDLIWLMQVCSGKALQNRRMEEHTPMLES